MKKEHATIVEKLTDALQKFSETLVKEKVIKGRKWYTVQFYLRKQGKRFYFDELRVSGIKREFPDMIYPNTLSNLEPK